MNESRRAMVIGGGVIGTSCAHFLNRDGWEVTILEAGRHAGACSHGNCGFVCPSHILPLAEPGAVSGALKAMFARNAPFAIKPRLDWSLWSWLINFGRRCNEADCLESAHGIQPLLESSLALYDRLIQDEPLDCEWQKQGLMYVYRDKARFESFQATNDLLAEKFNHPAERYDGEAVTEFEPSLQSGLAGGWFYPRDAHLRPDKLLQSWRSVLERRGVRIVEQCEVQKFNVQDGQAASLSTTQGEFTAERFVVATGALTPRLSSWLGCRVPIQPGKGYSLTMPRPEICPRFPLIFPECRVAVTPMDSALRLGSIMEFAGYDNSVRPERVQLLKDGATQFLREPITEPIQETWSGWRPMTYDSRPIIDRSPAMGNVWIAAGHNMLGVSMAPATGRLISELIGEHAPHVDPTPYKVSRF